MPEFLVCRTIQFADEVDKVRQDSFKLDPISSYGLNERHRYQELMMFKFGV